MRTSVRPRHEAPASLIAIVRPFMRYSSHRDAFVLRGVGDRFGPVIVRRKHHGVGSATASGPATRS
jgi:hypothetical protein